jgi:dCMP deaminase
MKTKKIETFLKAAQDIAQLSPDLETKVGCVLVKDGAVIATGYNGFLRNAEDKALPKLRPEKYEYMIHSEVNCIYNCARNGIKLQGAVAFCTLSPCRDCAKALFQCGVEEIYFTNTYKSFKSVLTSKDFKIKLEDFGSYKKMTRIYNENKSGVIKKAIIKYTNSLFSRFKNKKD